MAEEKQIQPPERQNKISEKIRKIPNGWIIAAVVGFAILAFLMPKIQITNMQIFFLVIAGVVGYFLLAKKTGSKGVVTFQEAREIVYNYMIYMQKDSRNGIKDGRAEITMQNQRKNAWTGKIESWYVVAKVISDDGNTEYPFEVDYYTGDIRSLDKKETGVSLERDSQNIRVVPSQNLDDFYKIIYGSE